MALAVRRWSLHRRIALAVIDVFGGSGASLVGGFMVASAAGADAAAAADRGRVVAQRGDGRGFSGASLWLSGASP